MSKKTASGAQKAFLPKIVETKSPPPTRTLSKALYQIMFNAVNDSIVLLDSQTWTIVEVNDKFCQLEGISRAEAKGMPISTLFTGESPFALFEAREYIQKALTEGPQVFEWLAQDRTGRRHWLELSLTAAPIGRKRYLIAAARDIQARKEAEEKVKQCQGAFVSLLQGLQDVALLLDPEGVILAANTKAARVFGRSVADLIGLNVYALLPPELATSRQAKADEVLRTGKVVRFEDEDTHRGIHIYSIVYPIFDASGRVVQIGVYAIDMTEDKSAKKELERIKARLECLLDHSPAALYSSRFTDRFELTYISKNIFGLTGFTPTEILADPCFGEKRTHPEDLARIRALDEARSSGEKLEHQQLEYRFRHKDGSYRWLHDEFKMVRDAQGAPPEYIGSIIDVTPAKEAQQNLALSEERYRAIVECQTDLIDRYAPDTTMIYVNDAVCRFIGKHRNELIGRSFLPLLHPKDQKLVRAQLDSLTPDNPIGETEHEIIMPDGSRRWLAWMNYAFFDDQGRVQEFQGVGRDITRRKEAEEALRESELRFRMYTEGSLVGVYVLQDNCLMYVNPVLAEVFGYNPEEMIGMPALELIHPEDRDLVGQKIAERLDGKPPEQYSIKGLKKDGDIVHIELLGRLVDYQGRPAILGSLLDVSKRWEAEEALRESEKKYRLLIETMNDGLGAMDTQKRITYVNPRMCELFGYREDELVGRSLTFLLDPANQKILEEQLQRRRFGDQTSYELVWTRKDGSQFPSIVSPKPIFDRKGNFRGSFAIITDITARLEAEAAVQRREQYFRQLTENVSDVIGLLSREGTFTYVNPTIHRLLGYRPKQLIGKSAFDFIHPDDYTPMQELYTRLLRQTNEDFSAEVQVRHRNGSWHTWAVKGKNLLHDPVIAGIVVNAQDITEQKSMEAALKQSAKKLRSLTAQIFTTQETERRRLSLELHDELGQSLTALKLQLRSMANKLRKDQNRLKQECNQMLEYINEVVENVRRLSHDLSPSLLENVGLRAALHNLLENFRKFYSITENLDVLEGIEEALPIAGKIHLYRIFQEILTNIEKHSQASEVQIQVTRTDNRLAFSLSDNGCGIVTKLPDRPESQVGLGLPAISERILMLGGTLDITGQESIGTRIQFSVPLRKPNQQK